MAKEILSAKTFNVTEHFANSSDTIRYYIKDDVIFIHAYESKSGKSIKSFMSIYDGNEFTHSVSSGEAEIRRQSSFNTTNVVDIYLSIDGKQYGITSLVNKNHSNKISISKILADNNATMPVDDFVDIIVNCKELYAFKGTSIIVGIK